MEMCIWAYADFEGPVCSGSLLSAKRIIVQMRLCICTERCKPARFAHLDGAFSFDADNNRSCFSTGSLPENGTADVQICKDDKTGNICSDQKTITVKRCGDDYVFDLPATDACPEAYCIGKPGLWKYHARLVRTCPISLRSKKYSIYLSWNKDFIALAKKSI